MNASLTMLVVSITASTKKVDMRVHAKLAITWRLTTIPVMVQFSLN